MADNLPRSLRQLIGNDYALSFGLKPGIFQRLSKGLVLRLLPVPQAMEIVSVDQIFHFAGRGNRSIQNDSGWLS